MKEQLRNLRNIISRAKLKNHDLVLIANNCLFGCIIHDFNQYVDTPLIYYQFQ